jgi:antitoxin component of RelBE/YafQ-DinJ toxin-antitoxin module
MTSQGETSAATTATGSRERFTSRLNLQVEPQMVSQLDQLADEVGINRSALIRLLLVKALREENAPLTPTRR